MRDRRPSPAGSHAALRGRRPRLARLAAGLALGLLAACGGGGGDDPPPPSVTPQAESLPDGLVGRLLLPDADLGRLVEQEPNDRPSQAFALPPVWARCRAEVSGTLAVTGATYGRADASDVFRFVVLAGQSVRLEVEFAPPGLLGPVASAVTVQVTDTETGATLAGETDAALPASLVFGAADGQVLDIALSIADGHAAYRLALATTGATTTSTRVRAPAPPPPAPAPVVAGDEPTCASTHVLVRLRDGSDADAFCVRHGLQRGRRLGTGSYRMAFETAEGRSGRRKALATTTRLEVDPEVLWVTPDWIVKPLSVPDDASFNRQWNLRAIGAPAAWDEGTGDASVVVAVIDSGIIAHPDLAGQTVDGYDFVSDPAMAADGSGRDADPTDPGDRYLLSGLSSWHGTHVAAIVGARQNDAYGVSGVAPGCRIMPLRVLGIGGGLVSDASDAVLYCAGRLTTADGRSVAQPVDVANLSIGLAEDSPDLRAACAIANDAGVLLVGAVGNDGGPVLYPAAYPSVFGVGAVDGGLETTQYSNFGPQVELAAPGGLLIGDAWGDGWGDGILSAVRDETVYPPTPSHGYISGTSQAAPHVAGAAALMLSLDPSLRPNDVRTILRATALDLGLTGNDPAYGAGLLQVQRAVWGVLNGLGRPRDDPPVLLLPTETLSFQGLLDQVTVPLYNGGGGSLNVFSATPITDDGAPWLSAVLVPSSAPAPPVNMRAVQVRVDRGVLPPVPGRYAGTVVLTNSLQTLGAIRVVLMVQERTRWGYPLGVVARDSVSGIARAKALVTPETGYRYWLRGLPAADYLLLGGEDRDGDGFLCEAIDACGWWGGPTEAQAVAVPFVPGQPAQTGLEIVLVPQP